MPDERTTGLVAQLHKAHSHPATGWLTADRVGRLWMGTAAILFSVFLISLPAYVLELTEPLDIAGLARPTRPSFMLALLRGLLSIAAVLMCFTLATILFRHKRADRVAVLASFLLLFYGIISAGPLERLALYNHAWDGVAQRMLYAGAVPWVGFFGVFPSGRFEPRRSRWLPGFAVIWALVLAAFHPFSTLGSSSLLPLIELLWILSLMVAMAYVQVWRYRHVSGPVERQQTRWIVFGLMVASALFTASTIPWVYVQNQPAGTIDAGWANWIVFMLQVIWVLMLCVMPLTMTVAVLRYRLWDVDLIVNRTLVYSVLSALIVGLYVLIVGSLGAVFQARGHILISLAATGVVAVLFHPLRERVQRGVNRLLYGERDDPYAVLGRLAERIEAVIAAQYVLPTIVETVADALKLPYAAIALREGNEFRVVAEAARKQDFGGTTESIPLVHQAEIIGQLVLAPRAPSEPFSRTDRQLLETIARQAGIAAHSVRLTQDLQRSRERLVTAREEERRRLRRDLHDGLGPALAAMSFKLDASANLMEHEPEAARTQLAELKIQIQGFLADIRRIAYNLRPPALDELGLVGALREHIASSQGQELKISLDVPETLPPLAAAVEVAAYRITLEALNNVQRHAHAGQCSIRLSLCDELCLEIIDNGRGIPPQVRAGVGLGSIRERTAELGGTCTIESRSGGGTRILVRLPLVTNGHHEEGTWNPSVS